jgi:hypothetical protein
MGVFRGPNIISDGLIYAIDGGSKRCYTGGNAFDIVDPTRSGGFYSDGVSYSADKGGYFAFDGGAAGIAIPNSVATQLNGTAEATLEMWVKTTNLNGTPTAGIAQLSAFDSTNGNLYFYNNGNTYIDIFRTTRYSGIPSPTIDPTQWHQFVVSSKAGTSNYRIFFNGALWKTSTGATIAITTGIQGGLHLGRNSSGRYLGSGGIGVVRLYDKALTDGEVLHNYNITKSRYGL